NIQINIKGDDQDFAEDLKDLPLLHGENTLGEISTRRRSHLFDTQQEQPRDGGGIRGERR
ncbi:hypothetical protein BHE74_00023311, partial [Ensete ventricosum]